MGTLILPMTYVEQQAPVIFLAGPIWGAYSWHDKAIALIHNQDASMCIATPNALVSSKYWGRVLKGDEHKFKDTIPWQRHYLAEAAHKGAILFWLPNEVKHLCSYPFAQDTRGEIAEWRGRLIYDNDIALVIGAEEKFPGLDSMKQNFNAVDPDIMFLPTLEETCTRAVEEARKRYTVFAVKQKV